MATSADCECGDHTTDKRGDRRREMMHAQLKGMSQKNRQAIAKPFANRAANWPYLPTRPCLSGPPAKSAALSAWRQVPFRSTVCSAKFEETLYLPGAACWLLAGCCVCGSCRGLLASCCVCVVLFGGSFFSSRRQKDKNFAARGSYKAS